MQVIRNNKKVMIVKSKDQIHIINKTEKRLILSDGDGNFIAIKPHDQFKTKNKEAARYV